MYFDVQCVSFNSNHDERASSAHAKDDFSSIDTDVSILLSNIRLTSCMDGRFDKSGSMQRLITSKRTLRSSNLKCFSSGSTMQDIDSGDSR